MEIAIVIPALNAERCSDWRQVLAAVASQTVYPVRKIVINSSSDDATCAIAESFGWECRTIKRKDFNHGGTRDSIVRELFGSGIDTVVFLSQDVTLASPDSLQKITDFLWNNPIAGCFGKQQSRQERTLNAWQRERCYPETSEIKTLQDAPKRGMMTIFFSNAFAAWKTAEVIRYGGFPETDFGEDTLLAANVLNQGGAVGYCAETVVFHDHPNTPAALFLRGMQIGAFHRKHPELLLQFRKSRFASLAPIPWSVCLPLGIKVFGYFCGRIGKKIIPWALFLLMWFLLLPAIIFYDFPLRDVAARYAPMAEAFAQGDWQYAFHPRVPPLLTATAGVISWITACNGYAACQMAASLFLAIGIFPLYAGCNKIYGAKTTLAVGILYALCPPFLRLGYYGLRETGGVLGIAMLFYAATAFHEKRHNLQGYLWFGASEAILLLSRGDLALFAVIAGVLLFIWDTYRNHIPWRSILSGAVMLILTTPQLLYNYRMIGYPVPEVRHAAVMRKICPKFPPLKCIENPHPAMPLDIREAQIE